ncbi:MAG: 5'-3' exonuclease H3TH domain-containing protein [Patescibacteria group bacterium]|nr:hypothetical protein [Patescibacteria group bacterium]
MKTFVIIDGNALFHRAYHALPPLKTKKGKVVNAVYGFTSILFKVIQELTPDYLAVSFDLPGPTFRNLEYKDYKAKRIKPPQELYDQIPLIKEMVNILNIPIYEKKGFEADDIIGTIIEKIKNKKLKIKSFIITGDLDVLQLVDDNVNIYTFKKGIKDFFVYNKAEINKRYGLKPKQIIDFKGLKGDPSDNIPGVPGIGEKTAIELLKEFKSLEELYKNLESSNLNIKIKARLLEYKEQAFFSQYLATIKLDVPIDFDLEKAEWGDYNRDKVNKFLKSLDFNTLVERLSMLK